jgi:hypothetical protein
MHPMGIIPKSKIPTARAKYKDNLPIDCFWIWTDVLC